MLRRIYFFGGTAAYVLVFLLLALRPMTASAQTAGALNLTTSPLPLSLKAKPGETITTELRIKNGGAQTENLTINLLKFTANNDQGQPRLADREPGDDYFNWVTFSEKNFKAEPNVWKTIKMTIKIPKTAALGYYYAAVFSRATNDTAPEGASIAGGTATLVLLDVFSPNAKREMNIASFTGKKKIYEFLPASFTVKMHNSGNIHGIPSGTIFVKKGDEQIAVINVNNVKGNVLPGTDREFTVGWNDGFPHYEDKLVDGKIVNGKNGQPVTNLKWNMGNGAKLRFGKYTATLLMVYDDGERDIPLEATMTFWVIPWRIIGVFAVIGLIIGIGLFTILRKAYKGTRKLTKKKPAANHADHKE